MKRNIGLVFAAACLLCVNAFATLKDARNAYRTMYVPYDNAVRVANVPRDIILRLRHAESLMT